MTMRAMMVLAALAALTCKESEPGGPVALDDATLAGPTAAVASCPCWDEGRLGIAFPAVHFYRDADGAASLTRFDLADSQQIQALVRFAQEGPGSCELATFGTAGRIEALASSEGLTEGQCEACAALLVKSATVHGFVVVDQPVE